MLHYSCDRCRRTLGQHETRYVVRMEVQVATDDTLDAHDSDHDHLLEVHEILEAMDERDSGDLNERLYTRKCYDLCEDCRDTLIANPLGHSKSLHNLPFSAN